MAALNALNLEKNLCEEVCFWGKTQMPRVLKRNHKNLYQESAPIKQKLVNKLKNTKPDYGPLGPTHVTY
jgi:hypothetical protein